MTHSSRSSASLKMALAMGILILVVLAGLGRAGREAAASVLQSENTRVNTIAEVMEDPDLN